MVSESAGWEVLDLVPTMFGIEGQRFGLTVARFEEESPIVELSSPHLEGVHEKCGNTVSAKVGTDPEPFDFTRRQIRRADRSKPNPTD